MKVKDKNWLRVRIHRFIDDKITFLAILFNIVIAFYICLLGFLILLVIMDGICETITNY